MLRKMSICRLLVLFFSLTGLSLLTGCAATDQHTAHSSVIAPDKNILRVGVSTNAAPLIFKQGDKIVGLEADFAREFAEYLGRSLRFVELKWDEQITALLENRIDIIMSGMTRTPLREVRISFSDPYFKSGQMALIRREDSARFSTGLFSFATSSAIGVIKDTTGEYYVETRYSSVKRKLFSTSRPAAKALINKRIDIFIHDAPIILYLASENETNGLTALFALLTQENLAWGIRKDNKNLLKSANSFLQTLNKQERLKRIISQWIPFTK